MSDFQNLNPTANEIKRWVVNLTRNKDIPVEYRSRGSTIFLTRKSGLTAIIRLRSLDPVIWSIQIEGEEIATRGNLHDAVFRTLQSIL